MISNQERQNRRAANLRSYRSHYNGEPKVSPHPYWPGYYEANMGIPYTSFGVTVQTDDPNIARAALWNAILRVAG